MIHPDRLVSNSNWITWDNAKPANTSSASSSKTSNKRELLFPWIDTSSITSSGDPGGSGVPGGSGGSRGSGGSGGSGSSTTARQRLAAKNQISVSKYNAQSVKDELKAANRNFTQGDKQNRARAKKNMQNNSRTASSDRFAQLQKMQSSARGLMAGAGNALQGGQAMNVAGMLKSRYGLDNNESLRTLTTNQNAVIDALNESLNANALARNSAAAAAARALRGIEADLAAQLNNINPKLYKKPGKGSTNLGSKKIADKKAYTPTLRNSVGYFTQAPGTVNAPATQNSGSSYFDQLMRGGY